MNESLLLKAVLSSAHHYKCKLYRNNVGLFETINKGGKRRKVRTGLCKGSSDGIGYTIKEVTQNMVGDKIAIFTAIETKVGKNKASPEQEMFIDEVNRNGGIAGIVRDPEELENLLRSK
jgi:hypothetical protein